MSDNRLAFEKLAGLGRHFTLGADVDLAGRSEGAVLLLPLVHQPIRVDPVVKFGQRLLDLAKTSLVIVEVILGLGHFHAIPFEFDAGHVVGQFQLLGLHRVHGFVGRLKRALLEAELFLFLLQFRGESLEVLGIALDLNRDLFAGPGAIVHDKRLLAALVLLEKLLSVRQFIVVLLSRSRDVPDPDVRRRFDRWRPCGAPA